MIRDHPLHGDPLPSASRLFLNVSLAVIRYQLHYDSS
jgi:hypothetical protein